jgi:Ketopantoate hydroxymethyltransferase
MLFVVSSVVRGVKNAVVVAPLQFKSYQSSIDKALLKAGIFIKEAGAGAVKLEGGAEIAETISAIGNIGIPGVAQGGKTPQSFHQKAGYSIQGKTSETAEKILTEAMAVEKAGAFA